MPTIIYHKSGEEAVVNQIPIPAYRDGGLLVNENNETDQELISALNYFIKHGYLIKEKIESKDIPEAKSKPKESPVIDPNDPSTFPQEMKENMERIKKEAAEANANRNKSDVSPGDGEELDFNQLAQRLKQNMTDKKAEPKKEEKKVSKKKKVTKKKSKKLKDLDDLEQKEEAKPDETSEKKADFFAKVLQNPEGEVLDYVRRRLANGKLVAGDVFKMMSIEEGEGGRKRTRLVEALEELHDNA